MLGWRDVPIRQFLAGQGAEIVATEPFHRQVFIGRGTRIADEDDFERRLYIIRKVISARSISASNGRPNDFYIVSM